MKNERIARIAELINKIFMLLGKNKNNEIAFAYAEEINSLKVKIKPDGLKNYILSNYKRNCDYPSLSLFLNALGIKKKLPQALNAWENIQEILPYMKSSTNYYSEDKILISTLAKIGINYIQQLQEQVDRYTNRINPYLINELKERFIRYYNEFLDGKKLIELENNGGNEKQLKINYQLNNKNVLQSAKTTAKLNQFNNNVQVATKNIINGIRG